LLPEVSFPTAVRTCFRKYFVINGRAMRSEYWWFLLAYVVSFLAAVLLWPWANDYWVFVPLAFVIPIFTAGMRRMHDIGRSGAWYVVPFVNIVFLLLRGDPGPNRYGAPPG
jgi:uncharacterized membrane protein YhaH (DUF805 family)